MIFGDSVPLQYSLGGCLGLACLDHEALERITFDKFNQVATVGRTLQRLAELGQPGYFAAIHFVHHQKSTVLIAEIVKIGQHERQEHNGRTLLRCKTITPIGVPSRRSGTPSTVRKPAIF